VGDAVGTPPAALGGDAVAPPTPLTVANGRGIFALGVANRQPLPSPQNVPTDTRNTSGTEEKLSPQSV
jgi:hypothetical protein